MGHSLPTYGKIVIVTPFFWHSLLYTCCPFLHDGNILRLIKNCLENALQNNQTNVKQTNIQKCRRALKIMFLSGDLKK